LLSRPTENSNSGLVRPVSDVQDSPAVLGVVPEFLLTDQDGNPFGMNQLAGKAWVASFVFTRCVATCPAQAKNMATLQARLKGSPLEGQVRLVFVSVDPEHDTPTVLKAYGERQGASRDQWSFLTGPVDDVLSLSR